MLDNLVEQKYKLKEQVHESCVKRNLQKHSRI